MESSYHGRAAELAAEPRRPASPPSGFWTGLLPDLKELFARRELLLMLIQRELKSRYKDSSLGFLWSLARPLALLLIYYVALGQFLGAARQIPSFAVFIYSGLTAWTFYSEIVLIGTGSVVNNSALVKKIYLPREIFPLSVIGSAAFNFVIQLGILLATTLALSQFPIGERWWNLLLGFTVLLVYGVALALVLSAVNVYLRDVQYLVEIAMMIAFWASPIVYSWGLVRTHITGIAETIYLANPVTLAVLAFQKALWTAGDDEPFPPDLDARLGIVLGIGVVSLWLAQRLFSRLQGSFAQEL
jgi:ABC-2 type transport system permease protein